MAWKKIIVSGSQASLNSVAVDSSVSAATITSTGDISGSNLKLTGDANIDGNIVLGGNINLGDANTDNIIISGEISSSIIPDADSTYDLGSSAKRWSNVYGDTIYGDGSNLTNITVSQAATISSTFTNQTSVAVTHNFDSKNVNVTVYNSSDVQILPASVTLTSDDIATVTFDSSTSGRIVVAKGGHLVSGSVSADSIDGLDDRIKTKLNTDNVVSSSAQIIAGLPSGTVSSSAQIDHDSTTNFVAGEHFLQSDITTVGTVTSGNVTAILPDGVVSSSAQIGDGIVSSSAFSSPSQGTVRAVINGDTTNVDTGLQTGDSPQFTNLTLTGDLTVQGTTTSIETANLLVEDKFILLNSGSANPDQGGIIIDEGSGTGHAFVYNNSAARFGFTSSLASNATTVTPDAFASAVIDIDAGHTDIAEYQKNGNIKTDSGVVYIYS